MPAIVEFPQVVAEVVEHFADLLPNQPQRRHLAEYLTGLIVAKNKNVSGINAEFVDTTDQSCLNRFITCADWDVDQINARRLEMLQEDPPTRYSGRGVIAIDDVLIDHDGKLIKDVGWFWDHAEQRHKIAHDYLFVNYVCPRALERLTTIGQACRAVANETLGTTLRWAITEIIENSQKPQHAITQLGLIWRFAKVQFLA